jgi:hypothetical protein
MLTLLSSDGVIRIEGTLLVLLLSAPAFSISG